MTKALGFMDLVSQAEARIETISVADALLAFGDEDALFVDLRDVREIQREGKIQGALHAPRGLLEFWIDPACPYHKPVFSEDKRFIFYCNLGWRSALAADVAQQMGLRRVCHIAGGFDAWQKAGGACEQIVKK